MQPYINIMYSLAEITTTQCRKQNSITQYDKLIHVLSAEFKWHEKAIKECKPCQSSLHWL